MKDGDKLLKKIEEYGGLEAYRQYIEKWRRFTYWQQFLKDKQEGF